MWETPGVFEFLEEILPAVMLYTRAGACWLYGAAGKTVIGWQYERLEAFMRLSGVSDPQSMFADLQVMEAERLALQAEQANKQKNNDWGSRESR